MYVKIPMSKKEFGFILNRRDILWIGLKDKDRRFLMI